VCVGVLARVDARVIALSSLRRRRHAVLGPGRQSASARAGIQRAALSHWDFSCCCETKGRCGHGSYTYLPEASWSSVAMTNGRRSLRQVGKESCLRRHDAGVRPRPIARFELPLGRSSRGDLESKDQPPVPPMKNPAAHTSSRPCGASKSISGPIGTIPLGFSVGWLS